jgi:heptaprenyl diphosphate synthase
MTVVATWVAEAGDEALSDTIAAGLGNVEDMLFDVIKSQHTLLTQTSRHLAFAGGKRFRPMLVLLAAQFGDASDPRVVPGAVVCELTHLASLYHDDVMDEAAVRRRMVSANARWGNNIAVLTGDFLFAMAASLGVDLGSEAARLYTRVAKRLIAGQFRETIGSLPGQDPMKHYLSVVTDKTGTLIAASCELGALLAGADEAHTSILSHYGELLGVAFQLADDLLDVTACAEQLGKRPGTDLREKVASLPVLHLRACATADDARLLELLDSDLAADEAALDEALELLRAHRAMDLARLDLERYVSRCVEALDPLPDVPARRALQRLAETMLSRRN